MVNCAGITEKALYTVEQTADTVRSRGNPNASNHPADHRHTRASGQLARFPVQHGLGLLSQRWPRPAAYRSDYLGRDGPRRLSPSAYLPTGAMNAPEANAQASVRDSWALRRGYALAPEPVNYRIPCITNDLRRGLCSPRSLAVLSSRAPWGSDCARRPLPELRSLAGLEAALGCQRFLCYIRSGKIAVQVKWSVLSSLYKNT